MTEKQMTDWFSYKPGTDDDIAKCIAVRTAAAAFGRVCVQNLKQGEDLDCVLRKLKEVLQTAIGGIVAPWPK